MDARLLCLAATRRQLPPPVHAPGVPLDARKDVNLASSSLGTYHARSGTEPELPRRASAWYIRTRLEWLSRAPSWVRRPAGPRRSAQGRRARSAVGLASGRRAGRHPRTIAGPRSAAASAVVCLSGDAAGCSDLAVVETASSASLIVRSIRRCSTLISGLYTVSSWSAPARRSSRVPPYRPTGPRPVRGRPTMRPREASRRAAGNLSCDNFSCRFGSKASAAASTFRIQAPELEKPGSASRKAVT